MKNFYTFALVGFVCHVLAQNSAVATPAYGSLNILTVRDCSGLADEVSCASARRPIINQVAGGLGQAVDANINSNEYGGSASAAVDFSGLFPVLNYNAFSGDQSRLGSSTGIVQTYKYTGDRSVDFYFDTLLSGEIYQTQGILDSRNETTGGAVLNYFITLFNPKLVDIDNILAPSLPYFPFCGDSGVYSHIQSAVRFKDAGLYTQNIRHTAEQCDFVPLTLNPGDEIGLYIYAQAVANRGGSAVGRLSFDFYTLGERDNYDYLASHLIAQNQQPIPEPASFALLGGGIMALGLMYRRQSRLAIKDNSL